MAGKKNTAALSPEERIKQALVPADEQPYALPDNWCWTTIGILADVKGGKRLPKGKSLIECKTEHPYIRVTDFKDQSVNISKVKFIDEDTFSEIKNYTISNRDIYVSIAGSIGKVGIIPEELDGANLTENAAKVTNIRGVNQRYLLNALMTEMSQEQMSKATVSTTQAKLALCRIETVCVPLAPLAEQKRIVDRIEELFTDLDKAKEKAQAILDSAEKRKFAILYDVFSGKYTEQWREENGCNIDEWQEMTLQAVCATKITDGTHKTPTYCDEENGVPFISAKDVTTGVICWDNIKYITPELHEELYARLAPQMDDVLLAKNGTTGIAAIVDTDKVFDLYVTLAVLRPNKDIINPRFLLHIINSPICKTQFDEHLTGIGVPNLHLRDIKEVVISVPSMLEQAEIVRILDDMLTKEQRICEVAEEMLEKIELMKKAVLADAFRGRLGTNDPADESAVTLLNKIVE